MNAQTRTKRVCVYVCVFIVCVYVCVCDQFSNRYTHMGALFVHFSDMIFYTPASLVCQFIQMCIPHNRFARVCVCRSMGSCCCGRSTPIRRSETTWLSVVEDETRIERIPSDTDVSDHPSEFWWSEANLGRSKIGRDLGLNPIVVAHVENVNVVHSLFFSNHSDLEAFLQLVSESCWIILKLKMGDLILTSLSRVIVQGFNKMELNLNNLKFIISPVNAPLPIPVKSPHKAQTISEYFGKSNAAIYHTNTTTTIFINLYSKWIIAKILPFALSIGRICDFLIVDNNNVVYTNFRLLGTSESQAKIKGLI